MNFPQKYIENMKIALSEAEIAFNLNEIPVGCVIISAEGKLLSQAHNLVEKNKSPLFHAEMIAINEATQKIKSKFLSGCTLYCNLEPCPMCAGAILNTRIDNLVFGALDFKSGSAGSVLNLLNHKTFNHSVNIISGVLENESSELLTNFFRNLRAN